ncbi:hypothetical protein LIER_01044 [Lithospermum erythrorhizon]|uniref:Uncharacterized protein n=1 Tax=Lithospermum erythrorhizon TaxID=34254 RepID=A0AAV3NKR2_LITER
MCWSRVQLTLLMDVEKEKTQPRRSGNGESRELIHLGLREKDPEICLLCRRVRTLWGNSFKEIQGPKIKN